MIRRDDVNAELEERICSETPILPIMNTIVARPLFHHFAIALMVILTGVFSALQSSIASEPFVVLPVLETPQTLDTDEPQPPGVLQGDSDDPAIWVHPTSPEHSLVIATLKNGGLAVFDLQGQLRQLFAPEEYGAFRYNNVDLVYNFKLGNIRADIAVATDRANDTLVVFQIHPLTRKLTDITSASMPASIFGIDDGTHTAYGVATYVSPVSGKTYAFVAQRSGKLVAQLELTDDGTGKVTGTTIRQLELPVPTGDPEDSQSEGMVVDRFLGRLYVGMENYGVLRFNAEPDGGPAFTEILLVDDDVVQADVEGLTIYYGPGDAGYLLVSSQGNNTFIVMDRVNNSYLGSFTVVANGSVDSVEESDGADVINVPLGPAFPYGLLVVQDGDNEPRVLVEDEGELENIASNFKYIPWQSVASAFPAPLVVDTRSFNPRGTALEQVDRIIADVEALAAAGVLSPAAARDLLLFLLKARNAIQNGQPGVAVFSLGAFQVRLAFLAVRHRLDLNIALSLGLAAEALERWLRQGE
jgi:myo-inositol-hexaphosphate 3-phosphohydrolase